MFHPYSELAVSLQDIQNDIEVGYITLLFQYVSKYRNLGIFRAEKKTTILIS